MSIVGDFPTITPFLWFNANVEEAKVQTEAICFFVRCSSQEEVDDYWSKLTNSGSEIQCGWLKDRFGLCWQTVPSVSLNSYSVPKRWKPC